MSQLNESMANRTPGGARLFASPGIVRSPGNGWHEPYESRGSRTDLWGTGGEIPPVYPAARCIHRHGSWLIVVRELNDRPRML